MVRVSGLASGMDIDEIVSNLMKAKRVPLDKLNQSKQIAEWQRDDYRSINTSLLELDTLIFNGIGMKSSFTQKTVNISDPNAISVKSSKSTVDFSGTIEVKNLATAATMVYKTNMTDPKATLSAGNISIQAITKDGTPGTVVDIEISDTDTLDSLIGKINSSNAGVTAFYDEKTNAISFAAQNTGTPATGSAISVSGSFVTSTLNIVSETAGKNATVVYNGLEITRSSNTFTINDTEITLKQATTGPVTFASTKNVDAIMDTVTKFVDKYNEIIAKIKDKTSEAKYRKYTPLTAAQKKEMSEDEITLWQSKAKSGTLRSDSGLNGLLTKMRTSLYTPVSGITGNDALSKIGITTTNKFLDGGKLAIDNDKLRAAITEDPDAVYNLFMKSGETTGEMGVARRLRSELKSAMTNIQAKAGTTTSSVNNTFTIGKLLNSLDTRITNLEKKMTDLETRYYTQFTAMEKAISKANSQSSSLSSYFS